MKAFIPYHIVGGDIVFKPTQEVSEPQDTQWRTFGVRTPDTVFPDESDLVHTDNDSQFVDVVVVERALPSSSIKRAVREIAEKHFTDTGEKADKRMLAQWKEEYINDSLPNAPLKETVVRVAIYDNMLLVGTSSAKLANDVMMYIKEYVIDGFNPDTHIIKPFCIKNISTWLHDVLRDFQWENVNLGTNAKLYGINTGRKISISNDDALGTWTDLTGYEVAELQLYIRDNVAFSLNENGVFKSIKLEKTKQRELAESKTIENRAQWVFMKDALSQMINIIKKVENYNEL
mgnify:CR=1 FL=1